MWHSQEMELTKDEKKELLVYLIGEADKEFSKLKDHFELTGRIEPRAAARASNMMGLIKHKG